MLPAGHFGAGLTHGSNFVFEPLTSRVRPVGGAGVPAGVDPFEGLEPRVAKIFRASCAGCHNEVKLKGGLALDSLQGLRNGGDGGAVVVPGNPGHSEVMIRLTLTPGDKEHMPPPGKTPLTAEEVEVIRKWIEGGARGLEDPAKP
jgi:mono/diheme cytochrome c family protein